uniref:Replication factor A n=1 Tax=Solanum tuberosum TaxID=4113 RepID=M1BZ50_SOLTU
MQSFFQLDRSSTLTKQCQIKAVMYSDEIKQYAATLKLLNTYLISTAKVKLSTASYGKPIHKFYWILDKETVIEQIKASHAVEKALPLPTKLNITSFDRIPHLMVDSTAEIDILAIVLRCGPQKNAGRSHHRCREITLCDNQRNQFLFTLWEDFGEIEGHEIASKIATEADLLVILGRSIGISTYQGKQHTPHSTTDRTCKKIKPLEITEVEVMPTSAAAGPSNAPAKFEPPTPTKKV